MRPCNNRKFRFFLILLIPAIAALASLAVFSLWNGVLTDVLPVKPVTYWQALGILVLAKILFGGFPGRGRGRFGPGGPHMMKHWESMTPEQREKVRDAMRHRFGEWPVPTPPEMEPGPHAKPDQP